MPRTVLGDGRSGAGKTTFARRLGLATGFQVIHLDDFYPGWGGLVEGSKIVKSGILRKEDPGYYRWDWERDRPGEWVPLDPLADLIIEGVGSLTKQNVRAAVLRGGGTVAEKGRGKATCPCLTVWIEASVQLRRTRALRRDPEFQKFWDMWAEQEDRFDANYGPGGRAALSSIKVRLDGGSGGGDEEVIRTVIRRVNEWRATYI